MTSPDPEMPPPIPRQHLFGNPERSQAQISPDGRWLSWLAPIAGVMNLWVGPRDDPAAARPVTRETRRGLRQYAWTFSGRRLLFLLDNDGDENWHLHLVDVDGPTRRDLTPLPGVRVGLVATSALRRDEVAITHNQRDRRFADLYSLHLVTGATTLLARNDGFSGFVIDRHYRPCLAARPQPDGGMQLLKADDRGGWQEWLAWSAEDASGCRPLFVDDRHEQLFMRDSRGRDTAALVRIDLASGERTLLVGDEQADVGGLIVDPATLLPRACVVVGERMRRVVLDPAIAADVALIDSHGLGDWSQTSASEDDRFWVLGAASDLRPGRAYLFDRQARQLTALYRSRPELDHALLAPMSPVRITSRDGLALVSYLTLPREDAVGARPAGGWPMVLLVHGGPQERDHFGYSPTHQWLANRGYAVLSVNFRGSTGFGKAFVRAGEGEWGRRMDDDLVDAMDWAVAAGVADPQRVGLMGASYGGYATLVGLTRHPRRYACGIDVVGPSNLATLWASIPPYWEAGRVGFARSMGHDGTPAGDESLRERSPLFRAHEIVRPLLIAQGANDPRVRQAESEQMVAALKANRIPVTYLLFPDEGHGFARPENSLAFHAVAEAFLARHLFGRCEAVPEAALEASSMRVVEGLEQALPFQMAPPIVIQ